MKNKTAKTNKIFARTLNVPFTPCPPLRFWVDNLDVDSGDAFTLTNFARVERGRGFSLAKKYTFKNFMTLSSFQEPSVCRHFAQDWTSGHCRLGNLGSPAGSPSVANRSLTSLCLLQIQNAISSGLSTSNPFVSSAIFKKCSRHSRQLKKFRMNPFTNASYQT